MTFVHEDIAGETINIGDVIIYVKQGGYGGIPGMGFGSVIGLTKANVKVQPVDKHGRPIQRTDYARVPNGQFFVSYDNVPPREKYDMVPVGQVDVEPENIKNTGDRYYILKKI